jgi:HlyD family secretion protein
MKKKAIYIASAAIIAIVGLWFWFGRGNTAASDAQAANPALVKRVVKVERQPVRVEVTATGIVAPIYKIDIKSKASGTLIALKLNEGDLIKKGQLIASIEKTDALLTYNQTKADYEVAKANLTQSKTLNERSAKLAEQNLISKQEMETANLSLEQAKAQLVRAKAGYEQASIRLNDTEVRSPIDGIVLDKPVDEGQVIMGGLNTVGGTTIVTVADMNKVFVNANVDEVDIGKIKLGQTVQIVPDAFPDEKFYGTVLRIDPLAKVEQNVTRFTIVVEVQNKNSRLLSGMNTTVTIVIYDNPDALVVPLEALKERGTAGAQFAGAQGGEPQDSARAARMKSFREKLNQGDTAAIRMANNRSEERAKKKRRMVLVKDEKGEFAPKMIVIGEQNYDYAEVLDGLKEGDELEYSFFSRAKQEGQAFQDRMRASSGFGGTPSPQQRRAAGR